MPAEPVQEPAEAPEPGVAPVVLDHLVDLRMAVDQPPGAIG